MTTSHVVTAMKLGLDQVGKPRGLFFYDGGCGVCKFTVSVVAHYDTNDHIRYRPLQTTTTADDDDTQMNDLYLELGIRPFDLSTAIFMDGTNNRLHTRSDAILRLFPYMGFPFTVIGPILLFIFPKVLRDFGYNLFAKYRSPIWIYIKRFTGLGDTVLVQYRSKIVLPNKYISDPSLIPINWGLQEEPNATVPSSSSSVSVAAMAESTSTGTTTIRSIDDATAKKDS